MVTLPASTMTGIWRRPLEYFSIRSRPPACSRTLTYSKGTLRREKSSRAPEVYGQRSWPKISTVSAVIVCGFSLSAPLAVVAHKTEE